MDSGVHQVSDMLVMVKSREIQRAYLAEAAKDERACVRHLLAAAHLELVLADDYLAAGDSARALRSQISAASCFWQAGQIEKAKDLFRVIVQTYPAEAKAMQNIEAELLRDYPPAQP